MASPTPQLKSSKLIQELGEMLRLGETLDELSYRRIVRELECDETVNGISALGFAHAAAGKIEKAIDLFEWATQFNEQSIALNFCYVLHVSGFHQRYQEVIFPFADKFGTKGLTISAAGEAYTQGDAELFEHYMNKHISLLSEDEGRSFAMEYKDRIKQEIADAYSSTNCTGEQFRLLNKVIHQVLSKYNAQTVLTEVSHNGAGCYVVDIKDKSPREIAEMNYKLAELICMEELLDDCSLIARFSPDRGISREDIYAYQE
ncbi:hypothetical protein I5L45_02045 [Serratia marcescens]|uniref:hypothetical protein n=1 Tax=Serratia marcescens TaxID=615 RepID=UPI0018D6104F|nr:hypothetical protein [Serratia marcescens]